MQKIDFYFILCITSNKFFIHTIFIILSIIALLFVFYTKLCFGQYVRTFNKTISFNNNLKCINPFKVDNVMHTYFDDFNACNYDSITHFECNFIFNVDLFNITIPDMYLSHCEYHESSENTTTNLYNFALVCPENNINYNYKFGDNIFNYQLYQNNLFDLISKNQCHLTYSKSYKSINYKNVQFKKNPQFIASENNNFVVEFGNLYCTNNNKIIDNCPNDATCSVDISYDTILNNFAISNYICSFSNNVSYYGKFIIRDDTSKRNDGSKINIFKYNNIIVMPNQKLEAENYKIFAKNDDLHTNNIFVVILLVIVVLFIWFVFLLTYKKHTLNKRQKYQLITTNYQSTNNETKV